jgi:hypothetical protein
MSALFVVGLAQLIVALGLSAWNGATLTRIHATPATPQTSGNKDASGNGMTMTVSPHPWRPYLGGLYALMAVNVASTVIGLLAMTAAVWGSQLQMERFVRIACGLVCLPSPVWPFGLPTALVAFSALARPNIKSAFAGAAEQDEAAPQPSILSHWSVGTIVGIAAAVLVMATSFVPWMTISIFGITSTAIGVDGWHGIVVAIAGGAAAILVAGFATFGGSRLGQGLSALVGGLAAAAVAGYFAWEIVQPLEAKATSTVSGDASLQEFGQGMADAFTDFLVGAIQQRPTFGSYAAIACGVLLALVGTVQLLAPRFAAARRDVLNNPDQSAGR